jgi:hypothetical protein
VKPINKGVRENASYFTLLGRFAHTFAATEMLLRRMIRKMLGISSEIANVIVGSPPAQAAMEKISALAKAQKRPDELIKEFQFVSTQLGHIQ